MRVAITTAVDRFENAAAIVARAHMEPVLLPCIRIQPAADHSLAKFRTAASDADLVVATSARAIDITWPRGMDGLRVAAVGDSTAAAARAVDGDVSLVGTKGARALVDQLSDLRGSVVAYPHAGGADPIVATLLRQAGATLIDVISYTSLAISPRDDPVEAVAFGSPSAVEGWASARSLEDLVVASIGPSTSDALRRFGIQAVIEPPRPRFVSLAQALAEHLNQGVHP